MNRPVLEASRSPMNARRWLLRLECGHEIWVTAEQKPKRKTAWCEKCEPKP